MVQMVCHGMLEADDMTVVTFWHKKEDDISAILKLCQLLWGDFLRFDF